MPTFTPPLTDGLGASDPNKHDVANRLFSYYGAWQQGQTVWKDSLGAWHQNAYPDNDDLRAAVVVYDGGHVHPVTDAEAAELIAAGFQVGGHFDSEEQKWVDYALVSAVNAGWKGGDACASQEIGDGRILWTFADNIVGTVDADGYPITSFVSRNALVIQDDTGAITGQVLIGGVAHTPFQHPTSGDWWWPLDITLDGVGTGVDSLVVAALHQTPGPLFGDHVANDLLILNLFGTVASSVEITLWGNEFEISTVYNDTSFHYITGQPRVDLTTLRTYTVLARAPLGQLTTIAAWENWNGTGWSTDPPAPLADLDGALVRGATSITKAGSVWVLAAVDLYDPQIRMYRADSPQGPYTPYHTGGGVSSPQGVASDPKVAGSDPDGGLFVYYQPKFHEHLAPAANLLVLSYNRNVFAHGFPTNLTVADDNDYHVSTFSPQFVYVPTPEAT